MGWDPTILRVVAVVTALFGGLGLALYILGWLFVPLEGNEESIAARAVSDVRGIAVAVAVITVVGLALLVVSAFGMSWAGSYSWSIVLSVAGLVLIWRNADPPEKEHLEHIARPLRGALSIENRSWRALATRLGLSGVLVVVGLVFLFQHHKMTTALRPLAGLLLVIAAIVVLLGPWWLRIARDLVEERQARARAEEREEMACRVHDSVLQTLALIQRSADSPSDVVRLARSQERELRTWLNEGRFGLGTEEEDTTFSAGVRRIQQDVEAAHGVTVEAVVVGDLSLDERLRSFLAAGREASVNAAKWSGSPVVSLFAEVDGSGVSMFVRDTGVGFDLDRVPTDRRGLSDSIQGRMARLGGRATVRSSSGEGTEVALTLPLVPPPERDGAGAEQSRSGARQSGRAGP
jgi:signal transduction histidine kinase